MSLPGPPVLKTTIIHLNKDLDGDNSNYEILTNDYLENGEELATSTESGLSFQAPAPKKKRRRSLANIDLEELAKRKHETKQLHLIIEKRRRIKINREFEALKYLIPACRNQGGSSLPQIKARGSTNNGNKIDGMYKLTILKLLVEYILYLHHIIRRQHEQLTRNDPGYQFDIDFASIPLDVNQYRDIDKEFTFSSLLTEEYRPSSITKIPEHDIIEPISDAYSSGTQSPNNSPNFYPACSKYTTNRRVLNPILPHTTAMSSKFSAHSSPAMRPSRSTASSKFKLPDPALSSVDHSLVSGAVFDPAFAGDNPSVLLALGELEAADEVKDEDAGRTLLSMKKLSIGNLLN